VSEIINLQIGDVHLGVGAHVSCTGKGRKMRITPLTAQMASLLKHWLRERGGVETEPLFVSRAGSPLSRDAIEHRLAKYVDIASKTFPPIRKKKITMHVLRHSAAMRLMRAGIEQPVIALWLGHEQVGTTDVYLHADMAIKERALAKTAPASAATRRFKPDDKLLSFLEAL
jgi:integrase/recombinase XerD